MTAPRIRFLTLAARVAFYALVFAFLLGRAASAGFSHDENQFIAPGQFLADHGLLPYLDYPYTHMPYGVFLYALTAKLSNFDFLAGRLLNAVAWLVSAILIARAFKNRTESEPPLLELFWEFVAVYLFLNGHILGQIVGNALNHSLATVFALLALALFMRYVRTPESSSCAAFGAGACVCIAGLIRFNYASLIVVLAGLLWIQDIRRAAGRAFRALAAFAGGLVAAAIPALALFAVAPNAFIYGNYVYIRLNTIYYEGLLYRVNMQLAQKLADFLGYVGSTPVDLALYALLLFTLFQSGRRYLKSASPMDLNALAAASCALVLWMSAFAPTPTQPQYFLAPLPFLFILLINFGPGIYRKISVGLLVVGLGLLVLLHASENVRSPAAALTVLTHPAQWTPIQVHDFTEQLHQYVPRGRILSLLPMLPLEADYDAYSFAATGPFSWRTSLLLTPARRAQYGVTSPEELPALLRQLPPDAILTGLESSNAGFERNNLGGLETPFVTYARANGFVPVSLNASVLEQSVILWTRQP